MSQSTPLAAATLAALHGHEEGLTALEVASALDVDPGEAIGALRLAAREGAASVTCDDAGTLRWVGLDAAAPAQGPREILAAARARPWIRCLLGSSAAVLFLSVAWAACREEPRVIPAARPQVADSVQRIERGIARRLAEP
jgi:hypothetical protein